MKRVLLTGGSGFIGTNLMQHWITQGAEVVNLDSRPPANPAHRSYWKETDIRDQEPYVAAVREFQPECLIHLGRARSLDGRTVSDYDANTVGVENTVAAAKAGGAARVLFVSSQLVCTPGYQPKTDEDYCPAESLRGKQSHRGTDRADNGRGLYLGFNPPDFHLGSLVQPAVPGVF